MEDVEDVEGVKGEKGKGNMLQAFEKRLTALEAKQQEDNTAFVEVLLVNGKRGKMLWSNALISAINGDIESVEDNTELAGLVSTMMH